MLTYAEEEESRRRSRRGEARPTNGLADWLGGGVCSRIMARPKKDEDPRSRSLSWRRRKERAWGRDDNEEEAATVKEGRGGLRAAGAGDRMGSQPTSMGSAGAHV